MKLEVGSSFYCSLPQFRTHLKLERKIGQGGMAQVWAARTPQPGSRLYAIKLVSHQREDNLAFQAQIKAEKFATYLQLEAELLSTFNDFPFLVNVHGAETLGTMQDGLSYMLMDLVVGRSIFHIVKQNGVLSPDVAAMRAYQVGLILKQMHKGQPQVIHGDLKPHDLLIASGGKLVMVDLGIAAALLHSGGGFEAGTRHYVAPEIATGHEGHSVASDIFSLGVLLYFMVKGFVPHENEITKFSCARNIFFSPIDYSGLDPRMVDVLQKCLKKLPQERYSSVNEFLAAIEGNFSQLNTGVNTS